MIEWLHAILFIITTFIIIFSRFVTELFQHDLVLQKITDKKKATTAKLWHDWGSDKKKILIIRENTYKKKK